MRIKIRLMRGFFFSRPVQLWKQLVFCFNFIFKLLFRRDDA